MAVPPTIPTSFVPKQPVEMHPRHRERGGGIFLNVSLGILGLAVLLAAAAFGYGYFLKNQANEKAAELSKAQQGVSEDTVEGFLRLRNRLSAAETILNQHVALSQFFDVLESLTLADVRFTSLSVDVADDRSATVKLTGVAKDFNALAAQSAAFATESRIKQAIFSDISVDDAGTVSFTVDAMLDPKLVEVAPAAALPSSWTTEAPSATSTSEATDTSATDAASDTPGAAADDAAAAATTTP